MKTVLIISYSPLHRDPRILRQIKALKQEYKIVTIGYTQIIDDSIIYYQIRLPKKKSLYQKIQLLLALLVKSNVF